MRTEKVGSTYSSVPKKGIFCILIDLPFLADAKVGEFILRGPNIMKGYVGDAGLSGSHLTSDGFLRTGDIGYADSQGYLYIVDRAKEMIKVKG